VVFTQQDDIATELLEGQGINSVRVPDTQTAMRKLASGAGDAAVVAKSVGLYVVREQGIKNVEAMGSAFPQQQYCFAVRRNRTDGLLGKLNEGLTILKYNGEQEHIAGKWLSPWESKSNGVALRIVLVVVGSLLTLLSAAFVWSWMLRRKVRERTLSLQERTLSLQTELSERRRAEQRILKLNRLYAVTTEVDKLIVRIRDRETLFSEICRVCVEHASFPLAWVGMIDESAHRVRPVVHAGPDGEYLESIQISTLEEAPEGRGPGGTAAREGRPAFSKDIESDSAMAPWRDIAGIHHYRSCAAFPLKTGTRTVAVLCLYASEPHFFDDEEERALLSEVAGDISFALKVIEGEQRRTSIEAALHQSEERFRTAFEQAGAGMALCDTETRVQMANPALCKMLGYTAEEFVGMKLVSPELTHPDDLEISQRNRLRLLNGELGPACLDKRYLHKDGHSVWTIAAPATVRDQAGNPTHFITQLQDITERKRAEEELRQANETLQAIIRTSPVATMVHSFDETVLAWNTSCERLFGWTAEETIGRYNPIFATINQEEFRANRAKLYRGESILNKEVCRPRKDGTPVYVSLSAAPLLDQEGRITGTVTVYVDLTERKRTEQELRQACDTLEAVFRASPVPIVAHDVNGSIAAWNNACESVFGWRAEEVLGRPNPLLPPDRKNEFWEHREIVSRGERIMNKEVVRRRKDGTLVDVSLSVAPLGFIEGRYFRSVAVYVDLTDRKRAEEELRQTYITLESIFRASPAAIVVIDADHNVAAWNKAAEQIFGWTAEEAMGQELPIVLSDSQSIALAREYHRGMLEGGSLFNEELKAQRKDGTLLDISVSGAPMCDGMGRVTGGVAVISDITERKRAQEELRQAYETLEGIFSASPAAIVVIDPDFRVCAWNNAAEHMFGWTAEEVMGQELPTVPESVRSKAREDRDRLLRGEALSVETIARRKDGTIIDLNVSGAPMRDAEGKYARCVTVFTDITERKRAQRELREAYETLATTLRTSPIALLTVDLEGNVTAWNQASERLFGWTAEEVLGRPLPIIPGDPDAVHRSVQERVRQGEMRVNTELKRQRKDGTLLDVSFSMAPFLDASGQIKGALAAYIDLTERKQLEAQLLQSQKLESIGRLAGGVAHDFNNLLTVINGYIELLLNRGEMAGTAHEWLQEVRKAGEQASSLTRRLLAFSRRQVLQPSVFSLNDVVNDMKEMLQRLLGEDVELITELHSALWNVKADRGQFQQVIMNLAVNARDAMPGGGKLTITTANFETSSTPDGKASGESEPQVVLTVMDTGCGMDEETLRRIFEPFFTTKEAGRGTGLGLSTVWGIVNQSGGQLKVQSEPGKGTTFRVWLPRADETIVTEQAPETGVVTGGTETILLVEDQPQLRHLTSHILQGYGYNVREVANGKEALSFFEQNGELIDLVLTDIVMPGITGIELGRQLRSTHPEIKILYMSGYTDDVVLRQGGGGPGNAYLEKPFTPEGLVRKIRQVMEASGEVYGPGSLSSGASVPSARDL
jgi:PAS domain S-box-containing protein